MSTMPALRRENRMCPIISLPELLIIVPIALLIFVLGRVSGIVRSM